MQATGNDFSSSIQHPCSAAPFSTLKNLPNSSISPATFLAPPREQFWVERLLPSLEENPMPRLLSIGSTGPDVVDLQSLLNFLPSDNDELDVDGIFGPL